MTQCCELHCHNEWSLLDAVGTARHGAERAAELGMPALASTNHASLSGSIHHMRACWDVGVMPIVGVEAYYRPTRLVGAHYGGKSKGALEHTRDTWDYYHMVLLAKNLRGWRSLKLLTSEAYRCVTPETRVLTSDLRWVPASRLRLGDELLGFDDHHTGFDLVGDGNCACGCGGKTNQYEQHRARDGIRKGDHRAYLRGHSKRSGSGRYFKPAIVTHTGVIRRRVYRLVLSDGTHLRASEDHPWLVLRGQQKSSRWTTVGEIVEQLKSKRANARVDRLPRCFYPWNQLDSRDAGYVAGVFDGEGHVCVGNSQDRSLGGNLVLGFTQRPNCVLSRTLDIVQSAGYDFRHGPKQDRGTHTATLRGGRQPQLQFLGSFRPERLVDRFGELLRDEKLGVITKVDEPAIIEAIDEGTCDVVALSTSSQTYIAEGFFAHNSGWHRKPCIDDELLDKWNEGLIVSTACVRGFVPQAILRGDDREASEHMDKMDRWFGDDWYFEVQPHDFDDQRVINQGVAQLSIERGRPLVAVRDAHAPNPEWIKTQHVSVAIRTRKTMTEDLSQGTEDDDRYDMMVPETCYIAPAEDAYKDFKKFHPRMSFNQVSEAVGNTCEIASRCVPFIIDTSPKMPRYYRDPKEAYELLRKLTFEGLKKRGHRHDPIYEKQAEHELKILKDKDFCDVFLITWDFTRWARSTDPLPPLETTEGKLIPDEDPLFKYTAAGGGRAHPMIVSIRGSAGGSLVSYALEITDINPITWGLRFERFLNPDREGAPDFDLDFAPGDADLVNAYIKRNKRYGGIDKAYDLVAHGTLAAKAAISRVARVYDIPHMEVQAVTKPIDKDDNDSDIADLRQSMDDLDRFFDRHPEVYDHACKLQRQIGTISEHAAGVILSDRPLDELMPVMKKAKGDDYMVTAFGEASDSQIVSSLGFLKIDLLVVIELAKLGYAIQLIKEHYGETFDLQKLPGFEDPCDVDPKVMKTFQLGALMGVFQFGGSSSISSLTKRLHPEDLLHLSMINAVHRTATMSRGIHNELVERRHNASKVEYWDPSVKPYLEETLGLMLYQEQVMDVMVYLGGFSAARADSVRRIMSKYYRAKGDVAERMLGEHREDFLSNAAGIVSTGREGAMNVWNFAAGFSEYSFNKPHSGQYALLGYADALVKTYWPDCFYASLMTFPPAKIRKPEEKTIFWQKTVREARLLDVEIMPPDINESGRNFTVVPGRGVRFGLESIGGLGEVSVADAIAGRPYDTYQSVVEWTSRKGAKCNAGGRRALAGAGALDKWGVREDMTEDERLDTEEKRLGIALSVPDRIGDLREPLRAMTHTSAEVDEAPNGFIVMVAGEVIGGQEIRTQYGNKMARLEIAFGADDYRISVRPKLWEHAQEIDEETGEVLIPSVKELVSTDMALIIRGTVDKSYGNISVDRVELAESVVREMESIPV